MNMLQSTQANPSWPGDCRNVGRWLQHYLDGELEPTLTTMVQAHLETCEVCGLEFETYRKIKSALRDASMHSPELVSHQMVLQRLRRFAMNSFVTPVFTKRGR